METETRKEFQRVHQLISEILAKDLIVCEMCGGHIKIGEEYIEDKKTVYNKDNKINKEYIINFCSRCGGKK